MKRSGHTTISKPFGIPVKDPDVEIFRTDVTHQRVAAVLTAELTRCFPHLLISFDLEDCDRILRVKGYDINTSRIAQWMSNRGFHIRALE